MFAIKQIRTATFAYDVLEYTHDYILIRDECEGHGCMSITNAAEMVIEDIRKRGWLDEERRVYYKDTMGMIDELCHEHGFFTGFAPGPNG